MNRPNPSNNVPSHPSSSTSARSLTLTEELEKLEQSITLTLQEIDANFSRAHRIVTSSIIPTVERYGRHSDAVWQGTRFWKEFFEASANISLTGYEEPEEDVTQTTAGTSGNADADATFDSEDATQRPQSRATDEMEEGADGSSLLDSPSISVKAAAHGATPKANPPTSQAMSREEEDVTGSSSSFADYPSPYEALKREMQHEQGVTKAPATPGRHAAAAAAALAYRPSPFHANTAEKKAKHPQPPNADPLLHRVLDKNYRIQATPHTARTKAPPPPPTTTKPTSSAVHEPTKTRTLNPALDSSPFSPALEAPALRAEIFGTPAANKRRGRAAPTLQGPRTPGVSVQRSPAKSGFTPGDGAGTARKTLFTDGGGRNDDDGGGEQDEIDWRLDSDSEDESAPFGGMSPPKTIQFNMPGNKLLQTPAREASRRIVDDLLFTAGAAASVTEDTSQGDVVAPTTRAGHEVFDDSPSVVRVTGPGVDEDDEF